MRRDRALGDFVSVASFWKPEYTDERSFWLEHAPFAFWLVNEHRPALVVELGTYSGFSYLCFCQAIARLQLPSRAFAVDTWQGDVHMGSYDEDVLRGLSAYHGSRYATFSRLVQSTFDDAVTRFEDGSIDLLHLDGVHTYEAVRHDFETWAPKLSSRAVLLFHDTNVREGNFGVYRLWDELRQLHPGFEFVHGQGLGLLGFGSNLAPSIRTLVELETGAELTAEIRLAYSRLGHVIHQESTLVGMGAEQETLRESHVALETEADLLRTRLLELEPSVAELREALERVDAQLADTSRQLDEERRVSHEARARAEAEAARLGAETARLSSELATVLESESWRITQPLRIAGFHAKWLIRRARRTVRLRSRLRRLRYRRLGRRKPRAPGTRRFVNPLDALLTTHGRPPAFLEFSGESDLPRDLRDPALAAQADGWTERADDRVPRAQLAHRPLISVLLPVFNTPVGLLELSVESVRLQSYTNWELIIVDDGSTSKSVKRSLRTLSKLGDTRIRIERRSANGGISAATNAALELANGDFVAMLDHDDELLPDALLEVARCIADDPQVDVVYTDQEYVETDGRFSGLLLKPDWSPTLFLGVMFVGHLLVVRRSVAETVGGFDSTFDNVQDFEFMLRVSEKTDRITHVPKPLYRWRRVPGSVAFHGDEKSDINQLQARAVTTHLERRGLQAAARPNPRHAHRAQLVVQGPAQASVSAVVWPAEDHAVVRATLDALVDRANGVVRRVLLPESTAHEVDWVPPDGTALSMIEDGAFARALASCTDEFVLSIEPGLVPLTDDWLQHLLFHAAGEPESVAAVGALVIDADGRIEESGLILGLEGGFGPALRGWDAESDGYAGSISCSREVSAVSGRCAAISRGALATLGTDSRLVEPIAVWVDLSLRAQASGLRNVVSSQSLMKRVERTAPRELEMHGLDAAMLRELWGPYLSGPDPYHNPNFERGSGGYRLSGARRSA